MVDETGIQVGARISPELARRLEALRVRASLDGTPDGGPSVAYLVRLALTEWVERQEAAQ